MENELTTCASENAGRLEISLRRAEEALTQRYCALGKSLIDTVEAEEVQINRLLNEVIDLRRQLSKMRGEIVCSACLTRNPPESRFCGFCGSRLQAGTPNATPKPKKEG